MSSISTLLDQTPFSLTKTEKAKYFVPAMREALQWHYDHSVEFQKICQGINLSPSQTFTLGELPYIPVPLFKKFEFLSVPREEITKTLFSSGTSGSKSKVFIDNVTADRQVVALTKIMSDFLGKERRHFLIFDAQETLTSREGELSSRGTAIRGLLRVSKKFSFLLNAKLEFEKEKLLEALTKVPKGEKTCFFGFTWMMYTVYLKSQAEIATVLKEQKLEDPVVLHIGGWKKLQDRAVAKSQFNQDIGAMTNVDPTQVIDFYGMTEQLGTVYPDCSAGHKHSPAYSEVIIRDPETFQPALDGTTGFIQLVSPLPHSYPGISILSDDMGMIKGWDDCACGRKGQYFVFEKRSEKAELEGCGDTLPGE